MSDQAPPPPPPPPSDPAGQPFPPQPGVPAGMSDKSKVVAGILGILLGGFGVHQFYLGNTKKGLIQLAVSVVTCGLGGIWGFIEGIFYLIGKDGFTTDFQGRPLQG